MGKLYFYKRDPIKALEGMSGLSLEERGAYNTILDLIYCHDGAIDDDPKFICPWLKCNIRTWRRIRALLIDKEKLYLCGGKLRNPKADEVVSAALHKIRNSERGGILSGETRASNAAIRKSLVSPNIGQTLPIVSPNMSGVSRISNYLRRSEGEPLRPIKK